MDNSLIIYESTANLSVFGINDKEIQYNQNFLPVTEPLDKFSWFKDELLKLKNLPENWDGEDALPVFEDVIAQVESLRAILSDNDIERISDIFANPHGTVTIEWEKDENSKFSLEIGVDTYSYFIKLIDKEPDLYYGENIAADTQRIKTAIDKLYSTKI